MAQEFVIVEAASESNPPAVEVPAVPTSTEPEFVTAEAIPDPPSPFAFGLKALLALTAIAGVQFALMSYLGVMAGMIVGIGVCALAMTGLMIATVVMGLKPGSSLMEQLDRVAIRLVFGIIILFFGSIIAGGGQVLYASLEGLRFSWKMQERLGFTYEEQTMFNGQAVVTVLAVKKVEPGGAMGLAGVQVGDVIVLDQTPHEFLQTLDEQRGKNVDINIAPGAATSVGQSLENVSQRAVTLQVP
jgi:hypothetical protein